MIETDALVIGAGPVGLFQAFQLGLLEIGCQIVDSLPYAGGQCIELYADKPIFDIPGTPRTTGRALIASLLEQLRPFHPQLHLGQVVSELVSRPDGRFELRTSSGKQFLARTVFIAAGVGAFQPRRLKVDGLDRFDGSQLFYRIPESALLSGQQVLVVGGDEAALDCAAQLAQSTSSRPDRVTLLHRREVLQGPPELLARIAGLRSSGQLQFRVGQITGFDTRGEKLTAAAVNGMDGQATALPADVLLVFLGLSPKLGPLASWGLDMARRQLQVDTERFSTSIPGIFAVGDINTYPGKKKLILSGFHEAALAAFGAAEIVFPDKTTPLQYTTTSPRLHQLLGVAPHSPTGE